MGPDQRHMSPRRDRSAFTLVELVMVVTIIGIVAAIAVPRMTTATANASANALQATLTNVRKAIDCYYAEHNRFPGYDPAAPTTPAGDWFVKQLLMYSDADGDTNTTYGAPYVYGPYLRAPFPKNAANELDTVYMKAIPADADPADGTYGWVAVLSDGDFGISATDSQLDDMGIKEPVHKSDVRIK